MTNLLDWCLLFGGLAFGLFFVWRGTTLAVSPDEWMQRHLGGVLELEKRGERTVLGSFVFWMWRGVGGVLALAGLVLSGLMVMTIGTGGFLPGPTDESVRSSRSVSLPLILVGVIAAAVGIICLAWPTSIITLQAKALDPSSRVREEAMPRLRLSVRLGGVFLLVLALWALNLWLTQPLK